MDTEIKEAVKGIKDYISALETERIKLIYEIRELKSIKPPKNELEELADLYEASKYRSKSSNKYKKILMLMLMDEM